MRVVPLFLVAAALVACGGPSGRHLTAAEYLQLERASQPAHEPDLDGVDDPSAGASVNPTDVDPAGTPTPAVERAPAARAVATPGATAPANAAPASPSALARQLDEVRARLRLLGVEHELALEETRLAGQRAERELRHVREDLAHFEARQLQQLLDEDAMQLAEADDELAELREELEQLEALYGALEPQGIEAELLERLRRRVERAAQRRELVAERSRDLRQRGLPRQLEVLRAAVEEAEFQATAVRRRADAEAEQRELELTRLADDERRLSVLVEG